MKLARTAPPVCGRLSSSSGGAHLLPTLLLLLLAGAAAAQAAPLWTFQLTASTTGLLRTDYLAARAALTQTARAAAVAAGGTSATCAFSELPVPSNSWLRGLPLALTGKACPALD